MTSDADTGPHGGAPDPAAMFVPSAADAEAAREVTQWALARLAGRRDILPPRAVDDPLPQIGAGGIGADAALAVFRTSVAPTAIPPDHPRFLAFIPGTPTVAAALADMQLSAAMIYGGSYLEGGRAVEAEDATRALAGRPGRLPRERPEGRSSAAAPSPT